MEFQSKKLHYGWIIVWVTFFSILVAAGIRSITGVIMIPLEQEYGWSRSTISLAFGINLTIYGFSGPFFAAAMEKIGVRKMMVWSMTILVGSLALSLFMTSVWQLMLIWGLIIGLSSGLFLTILSATVANRWFEKKRGTILGLLMAGTAAGQMIFLPLLSFLTEAYSWRIALSVFVGLGAMLIPLIAIFMRNRPEEKGILRYGADGQEEESSVGDKRNPIKVAFLGLMEGARSVPFWLLAASFFICGFSTTGLIGTHFIPASTHHGIPEVHAASLFAFMGILNMVGTLLSGWLSDRFSNYWLLFWYYGLRGLSLLVLPYAFESQSYLMLIGFAVFYGLDWIATVPPTVRLCSHYFGNDKGPLIYGWVFASHQVGSGAAAFMAGYLFELNQSYTFTFITAGLLCIVATLFVIRAKGHQPETIVPKETTKTVG